MAMLLSFGGTLDAATAARQNYGRCFVVHRDDQRLADDIRGVGGGRFALCHAANQQFASELAVRIARFAQWQPLSKFADQFEDIERTTSRLKLLW